MHFHAVVENKCPSQHLGTTDNFSNVPLHPPNSRTGYVVLFRHITRCPWRFVADKTQRIKFVLYSFSENKSSQKLPSSSNLKTNQGVNCPWSVSFEEPGIEPRTHEVDICGFNSRESFLYTSKRNVVLLLGTHNKHLSPSTPHLVKFEGLNFFIFLV